MQYFDNSFSILNNRKKMNQTNLQAVADGGGDAQLRDTSPARITSERRISNQELEARASKHLMVYD